jgi:hypothetical protein
MRDTMELPPGLPPVGLDAASRRALSGWLLLAVGSLAVAGALALLLALSRTPVVQDWLPWRWETFFRKALVAHVIFAFVVWYMAVLGGLAAATRPGGVASLIGLTLSTAGAVLLLVPTLTNQGQASLNNYLPVLVHPLFYGGLALLALGVALPVLYLLLRPPVWGGSLAMGVGSAGVLYLLALLCFGLAWFGLPKDAPLDTYNEEIFWGGGHILQFVHSALMLTAWQVLGEQAFGQSPLPARAWRFVCLLLVVAGLPGPLLYAVYKVTGDDLRRAFTQLYWIGLPLPLLIGSAAALRSILRGPRDWRSPAFLGLALSVALCTLGGVLGMFATGGDVRTPAHYHAAIGAVNLAFMGLFFVVLLPVVLRAGETSPLVRLQFWLYGGGQTLFSLGMFIAGSAGVARKVAGEAQGLDSTVKIVGMALTGIGATVAVTGGMLFVWLALSRLVARGMR